MTSPKSDDKKIPFRAAVLVWSRIAILSFGGSAGQLAVVHRILVEEKCWISERRFLHALNYCMLLPGPEIQQLCIYTGWLLHRTAGGLVAGWLFVLPGFVSLLALSIIYALFQKVPLVEGLFFGLKPAVVAVVAHAMYRIAGRALQNSLMTGIAGGAFLCVFLLSVPFPAVVGGAAVIGFAGSRLWPLRFSPHAAESDSDSTSAPGHTKPSLKRALGVIAIWVPLWGLPVLVAWAVLGPDHILVEVGLFFSKLAVVTFGGAYAVLAYAAQEAVSTLGWLAPGEMMDGLGMAETTPGPLIMVLEFIGFMGAFRHPGTLDPLTAGVLGAVMATWVTFVPCFLWIFLGAPYVERLLGHHGLTAALSGVTAAVVGVVLNLAAWFALHVVFGAERLMVVGPLTFHPPVWSSLDLPSLMLSAAAVVAMFRFGLGMMPTLAASALLGAGWFLYLR